MKKLLCSLTILCSLALAASTFGQDVDTSPPKKVGVVNSAAFQVLRSHEIEVSSKLKSLKQKFTSKDLRVKSRQYELDITRRELAKLSQLSSDKLNFLTEVYGKKLVSMIITESNLRDLLVKFTRTHPAVIEKINLLAMQEAQLAADFGFSRVML